MTYQDSAFGWINDYVGVPFAPNGRTRAGWDCWGLVAAVYREQRGVALPDWSTDPPATLADQVRALAAGLADAVDGEKAKQLERPEPWALALVPRQRQPFHAGVVLGAGVLHAGDRTAGTVYDSLTRFRLMYPGATWWQWLG